MGAYTGIMSLPDTTPLADRLRPTSLQEFAGQVHLLGKKAPLRHILESQKLPSLILWGPPGSGKTTLARLIAATRQADFVPFSGVTQGLPELRKVIARAEANERLGTSTIVFIDEIHRWNKAQQDALLPHVERGLLTLIGATTENPSFEVNAALLSRTHAYRLEELSEESLGKILDTALKSKNGLVKDKVTISSEGKVVLINLADGDGRALLNILELAADGKAGKQLTPIDFEQAVTKKSLRYDKKGGDHYNVISAFIKSMRGSDPDAAVYYMARMLESGEDPLFIARRMVIFASEDVGNADPQALPLAMAAFDAVHKIGMPEARINLSHAATFLASAPKSNASYKAIESAWSEVRQSGTQPVPLHLRNAPTKLMKAEGYKKGYEYAHNQPNQAVTHHHLPDKLVGKRFYEPTEHGREAEIKDRLEKFAARRQPDSKKSS